MSNRVEVSFQVVMGPTNPGVVRTGSLAELYAHQGSDSGRDDQTLIVLRLAGVPGAA